MFYSLAECRPDCWYRERSSERLPGIYEFPRELQKRIAIATQFLGRPVPPESSPHQRLPARILFHGHPASRSGESTGRDDAG